MLTQFLRSAALAVAIFLSPLNHTGAQAEDVVDYGAIISHADKLLIDFDPSEVNPAMIAALEEFAGLAVATATRIDEVGDAADLACIYRGMAEDIAFRLKNLEAGDPHAGDDLRALLQDAVDVTPRKKEEAEPIAGPDPFICQASEAGEAELAGIFDRAAIGNGVAGFGRAPSGDR
jgi:hypothetical protein